MLLWQAHAKVWYRTNVCLGRCAQASPQQYIRALRLHRRYAISHLWSHFIVFLLPDLSVEGSSSGTPSRLDFLAGSPEIHTASQRSTSPVRRAPRAQRPSTHHSDRIKLAPSVGTHLYPNGNDGRGWTTTHGGAFDGRTRSSGRDKGRQTCGAKIESNGRAAGATSNICVGWPSGSTSSHRRIPSGLISHP